MKAIIALLLLAWPVASFAADGCTNAPTLALDDNMRNRVVHTTEAGFFEFRGHRARENSAEVEITLKHAISPAWNCLTWTVELLLPDSVTLPDVDGQAQSSTKTNLARDATATFTVALPDMPNIRRHEVREYRAVFVVTIQHTNNTDVSLTSEDTDGQGRRYYPVVIRTNRTQV